MRAEATGRRARGRRRRGRSRSTGSRARSASRSRRARRARRCSASWRRAAASATGSSSGSRSGCRWSWRRWRRYGDTKDLRSEALVPPAGVRPDVGGLEVTLSSTALGGFAENMRQLVEYPYGCLEQLSSRLVPFVALRELQGKFGLVPPARARSPARRRPGLRDLARRGGLPDPRDAGSRRGGAPDGEGDRAAPEPRRRLPLLADVGLLRGVGVLVRGARARAGGRLGYPVDRDALAPRAGVPRRHGRGRALHALQRLLRAAVGRDPRLRALRARPDRRAARLLLRRAVLAPAGGCRSSRRRCSPTPCSSAAATARTRGSSSPSS